MLEKINQIDLDIVRFIEKLRTPFLDTFFQLITHLGDKYFVIFVLLIIYWTLDTKKAFDAIFSVMISVVSNTAIKEIIRRPRPYQYMDIEFSKTEGYSFPSGHSQMAASLKSVIDRFYGHVHQVFKIFTWSLIILIPLSRVYLAQHYVSDVIIGSILGFFVTKLGFKLVLYLKDKEHIYVLYLLPLVMISLFIQNSMVYLLSGLYVGFSLGYYINKVYIKETIPQLLWQKIVKVLIGFIMVLAIYLSFKLIDQTLFTQFIKYLLIAFSASAVIPGVSKYVFKNS